MTGEADAGHAAYRATWPAHYLNLAETTDPRLRGPGQGRWLRELAAEQDNLYAALRWAITRRDADGPTWRRPSTPRPSAARA